MNLTSFKLDIDELIDEFTQGGSTAFSSMKRVWLSKKFSYIYETSPSTNLAFFMQSLYAHSIGYMVGTASFLHRLGGLYCLYCLYETQPFKPPFRVYLSLGELRKLRLLVADAKRRDVKAVPTLVKRMLENNMFLFGAVDLMEGSVAETVNQLEQLQNARIQVAYEKLFESNPIEQHIHMEFGTEIDLDLLRKMSSEYAGAKSMAIKGFHQFPKKLLYVMCYWHSLGMNAFDLILMKIKSLSLAYTWMNRHIKPSQLTECTFQKLLKLFQK